MRRSKSVLHYKQKQKLFNKTGKFPHGGNSPSFAEGDYHSARADYHSPKAIFIRA
jgi:hypothetical protein